MVRLVAPPDAINARTDQLIRGVREDGIRFLVPAIVADPLLGPPGENVFGQALSHAVIGDADRAMEDLERLYEERSFGVTLPDVSLSFEFAPIRGDPRYQDLLRRIGFPPE